MSETMGPSAPTPNVQHLPTIFRRIRNGDIRIPAFQRGFVWKENQILELLESVYSGFPIGSLLLWKVDTEILKIESPSRTTFPEVEVEFPLSFVLDGMQRLSALYGVFNYHKDPKMEDPFNVVFNLRDERFYHFQAREQDDAQVPLSSVFSPKALMKVQHELSEQPDGDELIEKTVSLHAVFQEYMIPMVTIENRSVQQVVQIFERVNSTGTRLSSVDFMRAVTWSQDFDLNDELAELREELSEARFELEDETLVKALGVVCGRDPVPEDLLTLRDFDDRTLHDGVEKVRDTMGQVCTFLAEKFHIMSYDFVPYEGQILVLTKVFGDNLIRTDEQVDNLSKWFWAVAFNEGLRGKPDHFVARAIKQVDDILGGMSSRPEARNSLRADDFLERRFIKGKAMSCAVAAMFAVNGTSSIASNEPIDPQVFMSGFLTGNFENILPRHEVQQYLDLRSQSPKLLANIIVLPEYDRLLLKRQPLAQRLIEMKAQGGENLETLRSQLIPEEAVSALEAGQPGEFLRIRAEAMANKANELM